MPPTYRQNSRLVQEIHRKGPTLNVPSVEMNEGKRNSQFSSPLSAICVAVKIDGPPHAPAELVFAEEFHP